MHGCQEMDNISTVPTQHPTLKEVCITGAQVCLCQEADGEYIYSDTDIRVQRSTQIPDDVFSQLTQEQKGARHTQLAR